MSTLTDLRDIQVVRNEPPCRAHERVAFLSGILRENGVTFIVCEQDKAGDRRVVPIAGLACAREPPGCWRKCPHQEYNGEAMKLETLCLHGGTQPDPTTLSRGVPIYRTSSYVFKNAEHAANLFALKELGNIYTRLMNPTTDTLEKRVALLEGGPELGGLAVASGTSAVFYSIINLAQSGDNIVSARNLYGGTYTMFHDILPTLGIATTFVDSNDPANFAKAIDGNTRALFCETVSNPALEITDLEAVAKVAHEQGLPLIVDATFSTPYLTQPLRHGADVVVHSLTKWFGGHGTGIGGVVVDSGSFPWAGGKHSLFTTPDSSYHGLRWGIDLPDPLRPLAYILRMRTVPLRNLGACISPDNSWMFLQGIETLPLRMERHCENARAVAHFLRSHPKVEWVRFPGLENDPMFALNRKYLQRQRRRQWSSLASRGARTLDEALSML